MSPPHVTFSSLHTLDPHSGPLSEDTIHALRGRAILEKKGVEDLELRVLKGNGKETIKNGKKASYADLIGA